MTSFFKFMSHFSGLLASIITPAERLEIDCSKCNLEQITCDFAGCHMSLFIKRWLKAQLCQCSTTTNLSLWSSIDFRLFRPTHEWSADDDWKPPNCEPISFSSPVQSNRKTSRVTQQCIALPPRSAPHLAAALVQTMCSQPNKTFTE